MSGSRPFPGPLALVLGTVLGVYGAVVRPRMLRWGTTDDEVSRAFPGDELVPYADTQTTMATTLPAPPEEIWPWLQQMGCDRAGWYSWDRLDNGGRPSAESIVPEWQDMEVGRRIDAVPGGSAWFTAAVVKPPRTLVLRSDLTVPYGRPFDPARWPPPRLYASGIWSFHLEPAGDGETRLVVRTRSRGRPRPLLWTSDFLFGQPAHFVMQTRQFQNLRARVASGSPAGAVLSDPH